MTGRDARVVGDVTPAAGDHQSDRPAAALGATATDPSGNRGSKTVTLQVVDPNAPVPPSRPGERPAVVTASLFPAENARDVNVFDLPRVGFTEPLANVGPSTLFLRPRQNLRFNTTYELVATNALVDLDSGGERLTDQAEQVLNRFTTEVLTLTGRLATTFARDEALFDASRLFVLDRDLGLLTVDIAIRTQPRLLATTPVLAFNLGANQALALGRDFLYADATDTLQRSPIAVVVGWDSSALEGVRGHLRVFEVSSPDAPQLIGRLQLSDHTAGVPMRVLVVAKGTPGGRQHFALVGEITAGVAVVDLQRVVADTLHPEQSLPTGGLSPALVALFAIPGGLPANPAGLVPYRGDALYLDITHGLFRLDLSNLPAIRGTPIATIPSAYRLTVVEDFQVGTDSLGQPILKDFAIVGAVTAVTLIELPTGQPAGTLTLAPGDVTTGLAANPRQGLVFVAAAGGGFKVVDIRDPDRPALLGGVPAADALGRRGVGVTGGGIAQDGIYAYLTSGPDGLQIVKYDDCCTQILIDVENAQHYVRDNQHGVLFTKSPDARADPAQSLLSGTMPKVVLSARLVDQQGALRTAEEAQHSVQWFVTLRYQVQVQGGTVLQPSGPPVTPSAGRTRDDRFVWASGVVPLGQRVPIPWEAMTYVGSRPVPTPDPFVGGGELLVAALVFRPSARSQEPEERNAQLWTVQPDTTFISARTGPGDPTNPTDPPPNYQPFVASMTPGARAGAAPPGSGARPEEGALPLRIEGQLAHVVTVGTRSQPAFKQDPALKETLIAYLQRFPGATLGVTQKASTIRALVTGTSPDELTIAKNLFRLIAFKETELRQFNDLTLSGFTAEQAVVPREAAWPFLSVIGRRRGGPCRTDLRPDPDCVVDLLERAVVVETRRTDGGFGILQLTEPQPKYPEVWDYRRNIDTAIRELHDQHLQTFDGQGRPTDRGAYTYVVNRGLLPLVTPAQIRMEMYKRYNQGSGRPFLRLLPTGVVQERHSNYTLTLQCLEYRLRNQTPPPDSEDKCKPLDEKFWVPRALD